MDLEVGTAIDRYTVQSMLGEGGMAVVYLCRHNQLGTLHALKVLTLRSRSIRERLVQEGRVQAQLRHRNIVSVTDIILVDGAPGLVMEFIEGPNLGTLLDQQPLTYEQAEVLAEGILAGVEHAHGEGLVHRDLKPDNILLALEGSALVPKIADFGLAKLLETDKGSSTRTGSTMGTPHYMSPEQVSDSKNVDHRTDVFALGAILYEMVCGRRAFAGDDLLKIFSAVAAGNFVPPRELRPDIPERMEQAILGALVPDRDQRIQSVAQLRAVWTGQATMAATMMPVPAGPFDAGFMAKVRSISTDASAVSASQAASGAVSGGGSAGGQTWMPEPAGTAAVSVESLYQAPPPAVAPQSVAVVSVDAPAASGGGGAGRLILGGGVLLGLGAAALLLVGLGAGAAVLLLGGDGGASPPAQPTQVAAGVAPVEADQPPEPEAQPGPATAATGTPTPTTGTPTPTTGTPAPAPPSPASPTAPATVSASPDSPPPPSDPDVVPADDPPEAVPDAVVDAEVPPAEPAPMPTGGAYDLLASADPGMRITGLEQLRMNTSSAASAAVLQATQDGNRDVAVKAWQVACSRQVSGIGDHAGQEALVLQAIATNTFSRREGLNVYGKTGSDLSVVAPYLGGSNGWTIQKSAIDAVVRIGTRTGQYDAARQLLIDRHASSKALTKKYLEGAIKKL